ncbi:MAG: cell division protein SepF [Ruminococcaceae bacterium]|nr:cell division protein SepF [Oscillospiraceae bacterium]
MDFFKNFKEKMTERLFANDEEYNEEETNDQDYNSDDPNGDSMFEGEVNPPEYNSYYSPTGGMKAPEYDFSSRPASTVPDYNPTAFSSASADKKVGTIYSMNSVKPPKFKLSSITLTEIYGAKEVAMLMMEKDTIIIVNFTPLSPEDKLRAMDFLDGARCVTNAIFAKLNDHIVVFVPENVELCGDFESQVDFESIR